MTAAPDAPPHRPGAVLFEKSEHMPKLKDVKITTANKITKNIFMRTDMFYPSSVCSSTEPPLMICGARSTIA
jgi:hypothetical protein